MNLRQLPIVPTIIVFVAASIMVWLGFWQWGKIGEQEARLQQYEANAGNPELVPFPLTAEEVDIAIRIGRPADSALRARKLLPNHTLVCASSEIQYFKIRSFECDVLKYDHIVCGSQTH